MEYGAVEDLFQDHNDSPRLGTSRINARLDELHSGGCNQRIAWSKLGCIAIINAEGTGVETRHLACDPDDGHWALSDAYSITNVSRIHENQKLQHVAWSSHGAELAVVDVTGRVSFYTVFLAINQLTPTSAHTSGDDDMNALVGFWWLPAERAGSLHTVIHAENNWGYAMKKTEPWGPFHPVTPKAAAVGITRGGTVKLWFAEKSGKYKEATCELETMTSLLEVFSHASVSFNRDNVAVLAAYTHSKQLRVYRLAIEWHVPPQQPKQAPIYPETPTLRARRVKLIPAAYPTENTQNGGKVQLTHLEVLAPTTTLPTAAPTILAVFSCMADERPTYTIVCRWELKDSPSTLHPSFEQLAMRRASISQSQATELDLHRLEDISLDKSVIAVWPVTSGTIVAFAFTDGSLDFRDRFTLGHFTTPPPDGRITNMIQAGFAFSSTEPCIDLVLSPNNTVAVRLTGPSEVQLNVIEFVAGPITTPANTSMACASLAAQHAYSCSNYLNNDDLILVARRYSSPPFNNTFLTEVHRALLLKMDFAAESSSERLIRNPLLQRCLSLQYALDFRGENALRTMSGKLAFATLHLRVASLAFGMTWNPLPRPTDTPPKPEALQAVLGLVRWFVDLMSLIVGDLIDLAAATKGHTSDLAHVHKRMLAQNSPALFLALASAPRAFLRYNCRSLRGLEASTVRQMQAQAATLGDDQIMVFKSFRVPIDTCAVKIAQFERILTDIDGTIRAAYHNISEAERATAERLLFVNGEIPEVFREPVERLLNVTIPGLREGVNVSAVFWHDVSWLGLHDDVESRGYARKHRIDAVRKVLLPKDGKGAKLRRCTRCCAVVEDATGPKMLGQWMQSTQRMCLCGTLWMQLNPYQ